MQKIKYILVVFIFMISGCAALKKAGSLDNYEVKKEVKSNILYEVVKNNIGKENFFIRKAEIHYTENEASAKILASIKYKKPDTMLVSLRNMTGFEIVRIFVTSDTVLINDRINRVLMYGDPDNLKDKYGVELDIVMIILGDYLYDGYDENTSEDCRDGMLVKEKSIDGRKVIYNVDCKREKTVSVFIEEYNANGRIKIEYKAFIKKGNILVPGRIIMQDQERRAKIEIEIKGIEAPWEGRAEFIAGKKYELIPLR